MGLNQRYQTTYECDAETCEVMKVTYDHRSPEGWFWGNVSHTNDKGYSLTHYYYACSQDHVASAFKKALNNVAVEKDKK